MNRSVTLYAPAKINLHLYIGPSRPDGFHDLLSLFQMVSLVDELTCSLGGDRDTCTVKGAFGCPPEENLITRACRLFRRETGITEGVRFRCLKRIPEGAGLGGGSSDAAAALRLLDALFETGLGEERLAGMAARLGSDVPFFLRAPAAIVQGRGELISPLEPRDDWPVLLVQPEFQVSTGEAYRRLDEARRTANTQFSAGESEKMPGGEDAEARRLQEHYRSLSPDQWGFYNSFAPVLKREYPFYERFFACCRAAGALYANISGSGSAAFALFRDEETLDDCRDRLERGIKKSWTAKMLASYPMPVYN
jgi:4-diphosphocytidyl-2-C-methyl-D-erythritol kinase